MNFYDEHILPKVIDKACSSSSAQEKRRQLIPFAQGRVLEIGMGSALNLPFYNPNNVELIWGLEPSSKMRDLAKENINKSPINVKWLEFDEDEIQLENNSIDTAVLTYTLCTIPNWKEALKQIHRVLKPSGKLIFSEHGAAPDANVLKWQRRLTPVWKKISGGCHLNRPIHQYLDDSGFRMEYLKSEYTEGSPKILGFIYSGIAKIR